MKMYKKSLFLLIVLFLEFLCFPPGNSLAERADILRFEPEDTLDEIRAKIKHNGYEFTVSNNWVFDMPASKKRKFLNRTAPLFPRAATAYDGIGPLAKHLGERQLPSSFDWRNYNGRSYIGPIRDQGTCGACYAFGACAAAEGAYNWANGKYDSNCADFSEAFIAFCLSDIYSGFDGCAGSDYDYQELTGLVNYGVCNDTDYPYTGHEQACQSSSWDAPLTTIQSWHRVGCNDINAIKTAITTYGVIDAAVYVGSAFQAYSGGIYQDANTSCNSNPCYYTPTNHIIALVGWDDNGGNGYWILRNSWGTGWGENGYMRIKYTSARVACEACYLVMASTPPTTTPTVTTTALSAITATSASSGGNVISDGGASVTARGVCWSTSANPTISGSKTSDGTGTGSFTSSLTGLSPGATYHVRAYATNSLGTGYGTDLSFSTSTCPSCPGGTVVLNGDTFPPGETCECTGTTISLLNVTVPNNATANFTASTSITVGSGTTFENGSNATLTAPSTTFQPGSRVENGAELNVGQ